MQTFLPYPDLYESAAALDNQRLGKQRVEVLQIMNAIRGHSKGWRQHPATKMWTGHTNALLAYGTACCVEFSQRGFKDSLFQRFMSMMEPVGSGAMSDTILVELPAWFGRADFHRSHQSNLIRKDPAFYGPKFVGVPSGLPYVWPTP
jgi:hypothetical protein